MFHQVVTTCEATRNIFEVTDRNTRRTTDEKTLLKWPQRLSMSRTNILLFSFSVIEHLQDEQQRSFKSHFRLGTWRHIFEKLLSKHNSFHVIFSFEFNFKHNFLAYFFTTFFRCSAEVVPQQWCWRQRWMSSELVKQLSSCLQVTRRRWVLGSLSSEL